MVIHIFILMYLKHFFHRRAHKYQEKNTFIRVAKVVSETWILFVGKFRECTQFGFLHSANNFGQIPLFI
jgi:hypothetical protein